MSNKCAMSRSKNPEGRSDSGDCPVSSLVRCERKTCPGLGALSHQKPQSPSLRWRLNVSERQRTTTNDSERQRTTTNDNERQRATTNDNERQRTTTNVSERQRTSANVSER